MRRVGDVNLFKVDEVDVWLNQYRVGGTSTGKAGGHTLSDLLKEVGDEP